MLHWATFAVLPLVFKGAVVTALFDVRYGSIMQICPQCNYTNPSDATFCNSCGNHLRGIEDPLIDRIIHKYRLRERIGGGGFGSVYRAEHVDLENSFAVKVLHPHLVHNELMVERFRREAQLLATLNHPNIVQVVDFGQIDGLGLYLVMEWLEGKTLQWHIKNEGCPPVDIMKQVFEQLLDALAYAHHEGIVHRDLKPDNMVWIPGTRNRRMLKVLDFGIARMLEKRGGSSLTESGLAVGTPRYMSPEQAAGEIERIDHRTDIYACGVLLIEMLTGRPIFSGTTNEILLHQMETPAPRLSDLAPDMRFPPALEWVLQRALAKNPAQRYGSADEFGDALFAVLDGEQTQIVRPQDVKPPTISPPRAGVSPQPSLGGVSHSGGVLAPHVTPQPSFPPPRMAAATPSSGPLVQASTEAGRMPETRAITPAPAVGMPLTSAVSGSSSTSGMYRGEKQSGQRTGQTAHTASTPTTEALQNNWVWAVIGLLGGVGVALMFYIFWSLPHSNPEVQPLRGGLAKNNVRNDLPLPPNLRDASKSAGGIPSPRLTSPKRLILQNPQPRVFPVGRVKIKRKVKVEPRVQPTPRRVSAQDDPGPRVAPRVRPKPRRRVRRRVVRRRRRRVRRRRRRRVVRRYRKNRVRRRAVRRRPPVVRRRVSATVSLSFRSTPAGAQVWVDSVMRGKTPLQIKVKRGKSIKVRISKTGYLSRRFNLVPKKNLVRSVTLAENIFR